MADLPSSKVKINDIEVAQEAALSEAFFSKVGSSINALIDDTNTNAANVASAIAVNNTQNTRLGRLEQFRIRRFAVSGSVTYAAPPETVVWQTPNFTIWPTTRVQGILWSRSRQEAVSGLGAINMLSAYQAAHGFGLGTCVGFDSVQTGIFRIELRRASDNVLIQTVATTPSNRSDRHADMFNNAWELYIDQNVTLASPTDYFFRYIGDYNGTSSATAINFTNYEMFFTQL